MDAVPHHPALDQEVSWPTLRLWVRWDGERVDVVSFAPARGAQADQILLPCAPEILIQLGRISLGGSRASLYATRLVPGSEDRRLVLCPRGTEGSVRIRGTVSSATDALYGKTRAAMLAVGQTRKVSGHPDEAAQWRALARQLLMAKRAIRRGHSVRAVSGGLPTLGKS
ncbi:hypothetical protein AB0D14_38540 [Streptomyces sp. NPDC048484]|uniref:hypothetical protein n=1 Tax=Streptomyces sp. NPDC048484 TaxID=3155146 RepID=UPI00342B5CD9